jgi:hypothetical protein
MRKRHNCSHIAALDLETQLTMHSFGNEPLTEKHSARTFRPLFTMDIGPNCICRRRKMLASWRGCIMPA